MIFQKSASEVLTNSNARVLINEDNKLLIIKTSVK